MNTAPRGWTVAALDDLTEILDAQRIPINGDERSIRIQGKKSESLVPYYGATGQVGWIDTHIFDEALILLGEDGVPFFDPLKHKAYLIRGRAWVNNHAHVLRAKAELCDARYLEAYLNSFDYSGHVSGSTRLKLTQAAMRAIPVKLAPVCEQKRIADTLDAVLVRVDACRERLDRVPAIVGRFRQAVLAAATSGALTNNWRSSRPGALWGRHALGELIADGPKNGLYKPSSSYGEGTRILRIDSFNDGHVASFDSLRRLSVSESEIEQFGLRNGDVVINRVNSIEHLGKCALIDRLEEPCVFESNMMRIRTVADLLPKYLRIVLCSPRGRSNLISRAKHAVNQASINQGDVKAVEIHLPSLDEQREIVRRVDALFALADSLVVRHATASTAVSRLTPALLTKAFRGELVPQDPNDEPAAEMLKRVAKQRSGEGKAKRGTRAKRAAPVALNEALNEEEKTSVG